METFTLLIYNTQHNWSRLTKIQENYRTFCQNNSKDWENAYFLGGSQIKYVINSHWFIFQTFQTPTKIRKVYLKKLFGSTFRLENLTLKETYEKYKHITFPYSYIKPNL